MAAQLQSPDVRMLVYCDDPSHPSRRARVIVANFEHRPDGRWRRIVRGLEKAGSGEPSMVLVDDQPAGKQHDRYRLTCRMCKSRPVSARAANLYRVFNRLAEAGVSEISLSGVAASL